MIQKNNKFNWRLFLSTRRYLIYTIMLFLAGILVSAFASYPQISQILQLNSKLRSENTHLEKLKRKSVELEQIKTIPEFAQSDLVHKTLPSHKPVLELLTSLNNIASLTQVSISDFTLAPGEISTDSTKVENTSIKKSSNYGVLRLDLSASGSLNNVEQFMIMIERISPMTTITNLSLSRQSSNSTNGEDVNAKAELSLNTFFFTQSIKSTIESPLPILSIREQEIFATIKEFTPSNLEEQTEIKSGDQVDFFGINKLIVN
jgi:hypothetical protein